MEIRLRKNGFHNELRLSDKELYVIELCLEKLKEDTKKKWGDDEDLDEALEAIEVMRVKIWDYLKIKGSEYVK